MDKKIYIIVDVEDMTLPPPKPIKITGIPMYAFTNEETAKEFMRKNKHLKLLSFECLLDVEF